MRGNGWVSRATIDGPSPAASSLAYAVFRPRNAKIVNTSRPPGRRWPRAPAITRSRSAQPSAPPLSAGAPGSSLPPAGAPFAGGGRGGAPPGAGLRRHLRRVRADEAEALAGDGRVAVAEPRV